MIVMTPGVDKTNNLLEKYSYMDLNINPAVVIRNIPEDCKSMVLLFKSIDYCIKPVSHWCVYNILPSNFIYENSLPGEQAINDYEKHGYVGPLPCKNRYRYIIRIAALKDKLMVGGGKDTGDIENTMKPLVVEEAKYTFFYKSRIKSKTEHNTVNKTAILK